MTHHPPLLFIFIHLHLPLSNQALTYFDLLSLFFPFMLFANRKKKGQIIPMKQESTRRSKRAQGVEGSETITLQTVMTSVNTLADIVLNSRSTPKNSAKGVKGAHNDSPPPDLETVNKKYSPETLEMAKQLSKQQKKRNLETDAASFIPINTLSAAVGTGPSDSWIPTGTNSSPGTRLTMLSPNPNHASRFFSY